MAIFDRLFRPRARTAIGAKLPAQAPAGQAGKQTPALTRPGRELAIREAGSRTLTIPALDFYGLYDRSPNGRFRVAWRDGDGSRGGARESGLGHYVLIDQARVVARGRMERPNDGKVADNGNFILNDWGFTSELSGTFRAFRSDGSPILIKSFSANLLNNGLSADGTLAACHTCNSGSEFDSGVLTIFDLIRGVERSRFRAESGWPNTYHFDADQDLVRLGYPNDRGEFAYTLDGGFLDRERWLEARLQQGDLYTARRIFTEAGGRPDRELVARLLVAVDRGLAHQTWRDERSQAFGWRLRGELLEATGSVAAAVACYESALGFDPKVGVKRRLDQLKRAHTLLPTSGS